MKVNNVVITLESPSALSQWAVPFSNRAEANKYAEKVFRYWKTHTKLVCRVRVQQARPIRERVGRDWRKAGVK